MSEPYDSPPSRYWEPDDDRIDHARVEDERLSLADAILDAAIEEFLIRKAEKKRANAKMVR